MKQAKFKNYVVRIEDSGSIVVEKDGVTLDNTKAGLREVADQIHFEVDEKWNTRQLGAKLVDALGTVETDSAKPAAKPAEEKAMPDVKATKSEIANAKIRVYGKAQNRTALGIVHAYQVMYPHATLEDMRKAFPDALNPDSGSKILLMPEEEVKARIAKGDEWYANGQGYFLEDDDFLVMPDKTRVAIVRMWTKPSFEKIVNHAKQYGIIVADFEKGVRGEKGGYRLEYLNGYVPPVPVVVKKGAPKWLWAVIGVLAALILALILMLSLGKKDKHEIVEVEKVVYVHDTLYIQQLEEIEKNFNAAEFAAGKAELSDDAKFVLHDLAKLMEKNPDVRLRLEGHTSAEGDAAFNQKLSEARAQAAVTFMVEHEGVDAARLEAVGFGSSKLKNEADPKASENRRTEFVVVD